MVRMMRLGPRAAAACQLAVGAVLLVWGLVRGSIVPRDFIVVDTDAPTDAKLYESIVAAMQGSGGRDPVGYYEAVAQQQHAIGAPTSPVFTVREPTLAWLVATIGESTAAVLLGVVALAALVLVARLLDSVTDTRWAWYSATLLSGLGILWLALPGRLWFHEVWAGLLVLVAVVVLRSRWWWLALPVALLAVMVREMAIVLPVACLLVALWRRRPREVAAWGAVLVLAIGFFAWHAWQVREHVPPHATGPGWTGLQGWPFVVNATWFSSPLWLAPVAAAAVLTVLSGLGWTGRLGQTLPQGAALLLLVAVAVALGGRPDNLYWGALWVPVLALGLVPGLTRLVELAAALRGRQVPLRAETGASGVEYALVVGLVTTLVIAAVVVFGPMTVDYVAGLNLFD